MSREHLPDDDLHEPALDTGIDPKTFVHPAALQWIVLAVAFGMIALTQQGPEGALGPAIGWAAIAVGLMQILIAVTTDVRRGVEVGLGLAVGAIGVLVLTGEISDNTNLARAIALLLVLDAARRFWFRNENTGQRPVLLPSVLAVSALLIALFPREMLGLLTGALAVSAAGTAMVVIAQLNKLPSNERSRRSAMSLVQDWFAQRPQSVSSREALRDKVYYEGSDASARVARFFALMGFAAAIASLGVIGDSTAVVIGAMLIAPLMTPLMGVALSLAMGWPKRLTRTVAIAASGALWAIVIGALLGGLLGNFIDLSANSQIQSRISPTMLDLLIAIAAGAAGAYGMSRPDVADSLPGVAISIALVPPLTVVGICYSQGAWSDGSGALLLFLTNALSIMVVGSVTFVVTGQASTKELVQGQQRVGTAVRAIVVLTAVVFVGLFLNGRQLVTKAINEGFIRDAVTAWVADADGYQVNDLSITTDKVQVTVTGPSNITPPAADVLAGSLSDRIGQETQIVVRVVEAQTDITTALPSSSSDE